MSQEILYTSAPEGLKAGSRGFCTVVSTAGMASNLAERLESLSGYRQAFAAHDAHAAQNPVNYAHAVLTVGGRKYHVLSSVRDAGMDYTQRSNKLAHHVALEQSECVPGGPAWVLSSPGFCETTWDGKTRLLPAGRRPPPGGRPPGVCEAWKKLTGDAGWAGVLAESTQERGGRPVSIIYKPGTDVLPLVMEAESLLSPERRWEVTFSTYFTKLPAGVECQWRFVLDGTPEAQALRRNPHATVIDLCRTLEPAKGGALVERARREPAEQSAVVSGSGMPGSWSDGNEVEPLELNRLHRHRSAALGAAGTERTYGLQQPAQRGSTPMVEEVLRDGGSRQNNRRSLHRLLIIGGLSACLLIGVGVSVGFWIGRNGTPSRRNEVDKEELPALSANNARSTTATDVDATEDVPTRAIDVVSSSGKHAEPDPEPDANRAPIATAPTDVPQETPSVGAESAPVKPKYDAFADIERLRRTLHLPSPNAGLGGNSRTRLARLPIESSGQFKLKLEGGDFLVGSGNQINLQPDPKSSGTWNVYARTSNSLSSPPLIATFALVDQHLVFTWTKSASNQRWYEVLRYCLLEIRVDDDSRVCLLTNPAEQPPLTLDAQKRRLQERIAALDRGSVPDANHLRFDLEFTGPVLEGAAPLLNIGFESPPAVAPIRPRIDLQEANEKFLEFELRLSEEKEKEKSASAGQRHLVVKTYGHIPRINSLGTVEIKREEVDQRKLEEMDAALTERHKKLLNERKNNAEDIKTSQMQPARLVQLNARKKEVDSEVEFLEKSLKWCGEALRVMREFHLKGKINFDAYVLPLKGHRVSIVHTKPPKLLLSK